MTYKKINEITIEDINEYNILQNMQDIPESI